MTTTIIISNHHLQRAKHWPEDFTDLIKPYRKPARWLSYLYRCGHCSMNISESGRHHSECGRMRFPSMYLNQQLLFIPTEATSGLAITPFVHAGLASVTTRLTVQAGLGRGGLPSLCLPGQKSLWKGLTHPHPWQPGGRWWKNSAELFDTSSHLSYHLNWKQNSSWAHVNTRTIHLN